MVSYCQTSSGTLTVTLNSPADQTTSTTLSNVFVYTPLITGSSDYLAAATLYINDVATTTTNSTAIVNATANTISYTFSSSGTYTWNVQVTNSTGSSLASSDFTLIVTVPTPTPTPTPAPTGTPTPAPTAAPTPTPGPTVVFAGTPTPTPTPAKNANQSGLSFLLIIGIAAAVIAVVGVVSAFFVMKKRVTEKSLRRFSSNDFQDWVVKRFGGRPGDPAWGIDGFAAGGQPIMIRQTDSVNFADIDGFVKMLIQGRVQKGTVVAFGYDADAGDGKLKAADNGIELEMLTVYQLLNKRFSNRIDDIANSQVNFEAPMPLQANDQDNEMFARLPNEPQIEGLKKPVVFVSYSNTNVTDQVKKLLEFLHYDYRLGDKEETPVPIPESKFGLMRDCDCAVITICAIEQERRYSGIYVLNSNVLSEISAAYLKYNMQVVLLVERKVDLPSNLKGLNRIGFDNDDLSFDEAMELEKMLASFRKI
jgi:hypothetical protein